MKKLLCLAVICTLCSFSFAQKEGGLYFGTSVSLNKLTSNKSEKDKQLKWINVNTAPDTWHVEKNMLVCSGRPIGVMRSEKQYENFILHVEWKHMEAGGNSGVFVWSRAVPPQGQNLPDGVEVQMLELDWVNINKINGEKPPIAYVHGELFGVGGVKTIPDNPRGTRSKSVENRCKGKGEWNTYDVVCVDGVIRLSVNGKFVNGITKSTQKKGYVCLESEGAEIHFRNLKIIELDPGVTQPWQIAPETDEASFKSYEPISVHPKNPHYFLFRDKPAILIGSTEHYGAVINLDFDYITYLDELASSGLNVTRTFTGIYVEPQGAFRIEKNTLAPSRTSFICPWKRDPGSNGQSWGNKFDLTKWDEAYFARLKNFIHEAGKRNIVVELDLFSCYYDTIQWKLSPMYIANNVNGTGNFKQWKEVLSLKHPDVLAVQESMVRKIISELKNFDNLYYEVCNEPYFGDTIALREWEDYMTGIIADAEKDFEHKHLISHNVQNSYRYVPVLRKDVSVYNFHYASPPKTVAMNYHLNKPLGDNETGFDGTDDLPYRREAWDFFLAGGALYNNLDYSFTTDHADGTFAYKKPQPGGGGESLRFQLKVLSEFINDLDFINMVPIDTAKVKLRQSGKQTVYGIGNDDVLALYINTNNTVKENSVLEVNLKSGSYKLTWINPVTGEVRHDEIKNHPGSWTSISSHEFSEDIALKISR